MRWAAAVFRARISQQQTKIFVPAVFGKRLRAVGHRGRSGVFRSNDSCNNLHSFRIFGHKNRDKRKTRFKSYLATGITAIVAIQSAINFAVVSGAIPPTGLPLPFVSAGGSSLVAFMTFSGVLCLCADHSQKPCSDSNINYGKFIVSGGNRLYGKTRLKGAKNSILPLLAGALLTRER